jgi:hypothetical protein
MTKPTKFVPGWEPRGGGNNHPAPLAGFSVRAGASPWKLQKLEESCLRLIREQLIDLESRNAAAIVVGMTPHVYVDDAQAIHRWAQVVQREKDLRKTVVRAENAIDRRAARSKDSVQKRQRFLLATAHLDADERVASRKGKYVIVPGPAA